MTTEKWHRFWERVSAKAFQYLPNGYKEVARTQLKDIIIKIVLYFVLLLVMVGIGKLIKPFNTERAIIDIINGRYLIHILLFILGWLVYTYSHEYIHYWSMKVYGGVRVERPKFGFPSSHVKSEDYYKRTPFIIIALAPVVFWGLVYLILTVVFSKWFWLIWFWQTNNICGAAGDINYIRMLIRKPESILVTDSGKSIIIYDQL